MSLRKTKSQSETAVCCQVNTNGIALKQDIMNQTEIDLFPGHLDLSQKKDKSVKSVHSISICINEVDESSLNGAKTEQGSIYKIDSGCENDLCNNVNKLRIEDSKDKPDNSGLPHNSDLKDKKRAKQLVRCEAFRESSLSPPPSVIYDSSSINSNRSSTNSNHLTVYNKNTPQIGKTPSIKSNSQSYSNASSPSLSRDSSTENNSDYSSTELQTFFSETLKRTQKDRIFLLRIEQELTQLVNDSSKDSHKFTPTSSYNRMLIHKVASYFGFEHNVDSSHTSVIVTKTKNTQIPEIKFKEFLKDGESSDEPKKLILKRDSTSLDDSPSGSFDKDRSPDSHLNGSLSDSSRSKSLEEREEHYEKVRARIFSEDSKTSNSDANLSVNSENAAKISNSNKTSNLSSLDNESQTNDCDKTNVDVSVGTTVSINNNNNNSLSTATDSKVCSQELEKKNHSSNNENDFHPNKPNNKFGNVHGYRKKNSHSDHLSNGQHPNSSSLNRQYHNRKNFEPKSYIKFNEFNDWNPKPYLNKKFASQNMPFNSTFTLPYSNSVDCQYIPRFPPAADMHVQPNQFAFCPSYVGPPLFTNEQMYQQVNYMNPSVMQGLSQANVPNSVSNQLNYNIANNSAFGSSANLPMPNNGYPYPYNSIQPLCGSNGVPYLSPSAGYNSFVGVPYRQIPAAAAAPLPQHMNTMHQNVSLNHFKNSNESDKVRGMKSNVGYGKNVIHHHHQQQQHQQSPHLNYALAPAHPIPGLQCPEVLDRNTAAVSMQLNVNLSPNLLANSHRVALQTPQQLNNIIYNNNNHNGKQQRHPNEIYNHHHNVHVLRPPNSVLLTQQQKTPFVNYGGNNQAKPNYRLAPPYSNNNNNGYSNNRNNASKRNDNYFVNSPPNKVRH